jgi:flavin-dependent thymidylate synthase
MSIQSRIDSVDIRDADDQQVTEHGKLLSLRDELRAGRLIECLDDGFVRLVDHMGNDSAIVQAARVSYGAGTKTVSDDRSLIRYLISHRHTSPLEMVEFKFHVRVPMDCWRQWIRHRTACLAGDVVLTFDHPSGKNYNHDRPRRYNLTVKQVFDRFQPTQNTTRPDKQRNPYFKRDRVQQMRLRSYDENSKTISSTRIVNIWESGIKDIYCVKFPNSMLRASASHLCLTDFGWMKLLDALSTGASFLTAKRQQYITGCLPVIDELQEEWVLIDGYDNYEVSNMGRIRSLVTPGGETNGVAGGVITLAQPRLKVQCPDNRGYLVVSLSKDGKTKAFQVHLLVLNAFVGRAPENFEARHLNSNRFDNRLPNIEWNTKRRNIDDRMETGCDQTLDAAFVKPVEWCADGSEMTYDLEVEGIGDGDAHNFMAGGVFVHNSVNEYSTRYSEAIDSRSVTDVDQWRLQANDRKQGSGDFAPAHLQSPPDPVAYYEFTGEYLSKRETELHELANRVYLERIDAGIAREQARKDLPLSTYTEAYWKIDGNNLFHFLGLRMDSHAQLEIRTYANAVAKLIKGIVPFTYEAFEDYQLNAMILSQPEIREIYGLLHPGKPTVYKPLSKREQKELTAKLERLGIG